MVPSEDVVEFCGWPRPPRWTWALAGVAVVAVLAGLVVAHTGSRHHAAAPPSRSPAPAPAPGPAPPLWPSAAFPGPPSDLGVLNLRTGRLDIVPGLELPPATWAGLAFDPTGRWLLATVSEGDHGELLAWRPGMPGPVPVASLPGPLLEAPPLLPAPSWRR